MKFLNLVIVGVCLLMITNCTPQDALESQDEHREQINSQTLNQSNTDDKYQSLSSDEYESLRHGELSIDFKTKKQNFNLEMENIKFSNISRGCSDSDERTVELQYTDGKGKRIMNLHTPYFVPSLENFSKFYKNDSFRLATYKKVEERNGMQVELEIDQVGNAQNFIAGNKIQLTSLHKNQSGKMEVDSDVRYYEYLDRYFVRFDILIKCDLYRKDNLSQAFAKDVLIRTSILSPFYKDNI